MYTKLQTKFSTWILNYYSEVIDIVQSELDENYSEFLKNLLDMCTSLHDMLRCKQVNFNKVNEAWMP